MHAKEENHSNNQQQVYYFDTLSVKYIIKKEQKIKRILFQSNLQNIRNRKNFT